MRSREGAGGDRRLVTRGLSRAGIGYPLSIGLLFASQVLVANLIEPSAFGSYNVAVSVFTVAALIAQLGLPQTLLRRAATALSKRDEHEARHEIVSALAVALGAALVCGALLGSPLGEELFQFAFPRTALATVSALVGIKAGLRVLENIVPEALRAFRDYSRATIFGQLLTNLGLCVVLGVLLAISADVNLEDVLLASVIVSAAALIPGAFAVAAKLRPTRAAGISFRQPVEPALWLSTVGLALVAQLDMLVVGSLGSARDVALYGAPFRLGMLVGLPLIVVNQVVTPLIAGWHSQAMTQRIERTLRATAGVALIGACLLAVIYLVAGRQILEALFGAFYGDGWWVLVILSVGQIIQTFAGSCGFALLMTGNHRAYAVIVAVSMPVTLALQVVGFELGGIEGLAIATAVKLALQNAAQLIVIRRRAGFSTRADLRAVLTEVRDMRRRSGH
ncbi:MAG: polysaccharide biosynthesis C-terminal domain-containing protein [Acidimicrobiia bacterium]